MNRLSPHLPWPLPALLVWGLGWGAFIALRGAQPALAALAGCLPGLGAALVVRNASRWRRAMLGAGFPLSLLASGAALPGWAWIALLALLLALYPLRAWRDAPLYPSPAGALAGAAARIALPDGARVLDAGCGLGHGLDALHEAWPAARIEGIEWSWPAALAARWRCRFAQVRRGDMWRLDWSGYALVYLFQRPESMARALDKCRREMRQGGWLASLEFEVPGQRADAVLRAGPKPVWLYRVAAIESNAQLPAPPADIPSRKAAGPIDPPRHCA